MTLRRLPPLVAPAIPENIEQSLGHCLEKCEFVRDWRKRHIAHRDLSLAFNENAVPLAPASRQTVREAIGSIAKLLNPVEGYYQHSEVAYEFTRPLPNAESLLYVLRDGLEAQERQRKRLESGKLDPEDLNPPPAV